MKNVLKLQTGILTLVALLTTAAVQAQEKTLDVNVDINNGSGDAMWYANPWVWVVGAAVFILLLAAILRGGGRTSD